MQKGFLLRLYDVPKPLARLVSSPSLIFSQAVFIGLYRASTEVVLRNGTTTSFQKVLNNDLHSFLE